MRSEMQAGKKHLEGIWNEDPGFAFLPVTDAKWPKIEKAFFAWAEECPRVRDYYERTPKRSGRKRKKPS